MKKLLSIICSVGFISAANAADITVYYSPSCPHCHHALEFIGDTLVYEYQTINVAAVNVVESENRDAFRAVVEKCEYKSGGVPIIVVGEKCFQGYADFMEKELRDAVAVDMSDTELAVADANRDAMAKDIEKFKSDNTNRANIIANYDTDEQKKTDADERDLTYMYGLLILLALGLGYIVFRKRKKK